MRRLSPPFGLILALTLLHAPAAAWAAKPAPASPAALDPDLLSGLRARSIGPAGMSGRVTSIASSAVDSNVLYVGAASGGVWKSVNGGLNWQPVFDDQPVASIGAIAVFRTNPDVVWVGTGESNTRNSVSVGNGVYRSQDGGKTWTHLGLDATEHIASIVLHPTNPDVAWVAALGKLWGENPERGVFKTEDGGKTWQKVLFVDDKTGASDLVADPSNPQKLFAAMWQFRRWPWVFKSGGPGSGLYVSLDGGKSWKRRTEDDGLPKGDLGRIKLAVSRSSPQTVYAMVEAEASAFLRSEDGGRTFQSMNTGTNVSRRPFYFASLEVDPEWPNRVYSFDFSPQVSVDAGKTWSSLPFGNFIHGDYHALWIDPKDPRHLMVGEDGGVATSRDRGQTADFVTALPLAQYYHVAVDMDVPYHVYGGLQDNGAWRGPSTTWEFGGIRSHEWQLVVGGDGFETLPDPDDSLLGYSESQSGYVDRWNLHTGELRDIRPPAPDGVKLRFNWNAGLAQDPFDHGTVYMGSQFLHRSTDRGDSWTMISPDLTSNNPAWQKRAESGGLTPDDSGAEGFTTILSIAPSPVERGVIWVGTDDGRVQLTRDGGKSWTSVEGNVPEVPKNTWVPSIRASRRNAGTAYVVFDNHRRSDWTPYVYRTDDFGKSWKSLASPDLRGYCLALEEDPVDPSLLYLGTEFGLWVSEDGGGHWWRFKHGVPTVSVMALALHPRDQDLVIATHGRGLYVLDDVRALRHLSTATLAEPLHLFESGDATEHWIAAPAGGFGLGSGEFKGESRPEGAFLTFSVNAPGLPLPDPEKERERKERERIAARQAAELKAAEPEARRPEAKGAPAPPPAATATPGTSAEEKEKEKAKAEPKAEIRVADATGKVIRTFHAPIKLGINRVVWGFERDSWKLPPPAPGEQRDEDPAGPPVPPGTYTLTVAYGDHEAKSTVRVLPDPRAKNTDADWQSRWAAIQRGGELQDVVVTAIERIARTRTDVDAVVAKARQAAQAAEDERRAKGGKAEGTGGKPADPPIVAAADKLKQGLTALEKRLWLSPDAKGLQDDTTLLGQVVYVEQAVGSSMSPPTAGQLNYLRQAGEAVDRFLVDFNRFYAEDVAAFRKQAEGAKTELLPELPPLQSKSPARP
ncbi:MAG TPA: hypothetical protein VFE33_13990 [Thermoanaerobaculia bacterium]|nr:hypothetical protein [Thermoanaerobaculia bacterium]